MSYTLRSATPEDASEILAIYAPYVADTAISFEIDVPTLAEYRQRIEDTIKAYPWLVCLSDNKIVGYAYASKLRERPAYRYSAELSVYIHHDYHRQGIGVKLYTALFEQLKAQNIYTVYAGVTLPNQASVGLHHTLGFQEIGIYHRVGYKFGRWLDVIWFEKAIGDYSRMEKETRKGKG